MKKFKLALITDGLMEDPSFHFDIHTIRTIEANNLKSAKQKWAEETNHNNEYWDAEHQTYWGWQIGEV